MPLRSGFNFHHLLLLQWDSILLVPRSLPSPASRQLCLTLASNQKQSARNRIRDHISAALFWCIFVKPVQTSGKRTETEAGKILPEMRSTNNFSIYLPVSSKPFKQSNCSFVYRSKPEPELLRGGRQSKSLIEHFSSYGLRDQISFYFYLKQQRFMPPCLSKSYPKVGNKAPVGS